MASMTFVTSPLRSFRPLPTNREMNHLFYQTRNQQMFGLIRRAIDENKGKRIIVVTGSEHKLFFDEKLADEGDVRLVTFESILPLEPAEIDKEIADFLSTNLARLYFDESTDEGIDNLYHGALTPLVHGPDMDQDPEIVPAENVEKAWPLLDSWQKKNPNSALLNFELGWYFFLKSSYQESVDHYLKAMPRLDEVPEGLREFVKSIIYRNLGFCYDLLGKRDEAVRCYGKGEEMADKLNKSSRFKEVYYTQFKAKAFRWER